MKEALRTYLNRILSGEITEYPMLRLLDFYYGQYTPEWMPVASEGKGDSESIRVFPEELILPLAERESGVYEALKALVEAGVDLNEGDGFNPLMVSVSNADAAMTEYLIRHGANPRYWPDMEEGETENDQENWYYEELDLAWMERFPWTNGSYHALKAMEDVLVKVGGLGDFEGICLLIETKNR